MIKLLKLFDEFFYENRLLKKGLLTYAVIDSLELDYTFGEQIMQFDKSKITHRKPPTKS